ncbi:MAG TPA: cation:proton antiporter [Marmoricola sp.]|nr:cation:proton antiporter [Marmoricola sp.]
MTDLQPFGLMILLVAAAVLLAALSSRLTERLRVPAPALFLLAAAAASDWLPKLGSLSLQVDERLVTAALIFILFDGGLQIGMPAFREAALPIVWIGVAGTLVTAGSLALVAHLLLGFDWHLALLLGTALSPTDPATVFAVLGRREITGRTGTILKGEAAMNDPVGIALMVVLIGAHGSGGHAIAMGIGSFLLQMAVGAVVGVAGGYLLVPVMRRIALPNEALYPIRALAFAACVYGLAEVLNGSGFLAVLLAGVVCGDVRAPYKREIERFASGLSSLAEIVVFTVLGLSVDLHAIWHWDVLGAGLLIALLLGLVIRPLAVGVLMTVVDLRPGERAFVLLAGLKGAVPILLGIFVLEAHPAGAGRVYGTIFVVVLASVLIQGGLVPQMTRVFGIPMSSVDPEPWSLGMRFRSEPPEMQRHVVAAGAAADGTAISDLELGESTWISMISRDGHYVEPRHDTRLRAGDQVLLLGETDPQAIAAFTRAIDGHGPRL